MHVCSIVLLEYLLSLPMNACCRMQQPLCNKIDILNRQDGIQVMVCVAAQALFTQDDLMLYMPKCIIYYML